MTVIDLPVNLTDEEAVRLLQEEEAQIEAAEDEATPHLFRSGDIILAKCPMTVPDRDESTEGIAFEGSLGLFKDQGVQATLKDLAQRAGVSWHTLRNRRTVASRIPVQVRGGFAPWQTYRLIAEVSTESDRVRLVDLVGRPNPEHKDGRWTEAALKPYLPKKEGTGSAPDLSEEEQYLDQVLRGIDYFVLNNDVEMLERVRAYWTKTVPDQLKTLAWWDRREADRAAAAAVRAERKAQKAS